MHHVNRDIAPVIGNCCIKNFLPELKIKKCEICETPHKRWKYAKHHIKGGNIIFVRSAKQNKRQEIGIEKLKKRLI